jgi:hypothetical protein
MGLRVSNEMRSGHFSSMVKSMVLMIALAFLAASPAAHAQRLSVQVYKYSVPPADSAADQYLDQFISIIEAKVILLGAELGSEADQYKSLSLFQVEANDAGQGSSPTFQQLEDRWDDANALQLFLGRVRKVGNDYAVRTRVFFGKLPTQTGGQFFNIDMLIHGDEFDSTRDSHSAVILYALALDACQQSRPVSEVIAL